MSFTSFTFIVFLLCSFIVFKIAKYKWQALLLISLAYYASFSVKAFVYLIFVILSTYFSAIYLEKHKNKLVLALALILNFGMLSLVKFTRVNIFENFIPLGISFYIFMATGYVIDVYRGKYEAQKNIFKYSLFVSFFPQMMQGPISRYDDISQGLYHDDSSATDISYGLMLILYGFFKKLVIADRAAVFVNKVFTEPDLYSGIFVFIAIIFYSIQIYCDFSGGIDVARGAAYLFGVKLDRNFKRPFFATSLADFWRRWHTSLGSWMKDYVFYSLSLSKAFVFINKQSRKHLGRKFGKYLTLSIASFVVYFIIGIWHGAGLNFLAFGLYNGTIISLGLIFEDSFKALRNKIGLKDTSLTYRITKIFSTLMIVFVGRYFTRSAGLRTALHMMKKTIVDRGFRHAATGLSRLDYAVILISLILIFIVSLAEEKEIDVKEKVLKLKPIYLFTGLLIFMAFVAYFGVFASGFTKVDFIYRNY